MEEIWGNQLCAPLASLISIVVFQTCHLCYNSLKYQEIIQRRFQVVALFTFYFFKIINTSFFSGLDNPNQLHFIMVHSKTKFNVGWLNKRDRNGHVLE